MALAGLPAWSVWWITTRPLKQPSSSGHDSPLFLHSGPHWLIPPCLHTWSPLCLEYPSPLPLPTNFYLSFKSHVRSLGDSTEWLHLILVALGTGLTSDWQSLDLPTLSIPLINPRVKLDDSENRILKSNFQLLSTERL